MSQPRAEYRKPGFDQGSRPSRRKSSDETSASRTHRKNFSRGGKKNHHQRTPSSSFDNPSRKASSSSQSSGSTVTSQCSNEEIDPIQPDEPYSKLQSVSEYKPLFEIFNRKKKVDLLKIPQVSKIQSLYNLSDISKGDLLPKAGSKSLPFCCFGHSSRVSGKIEQTRDFEELIELAAKYRAMLILNTL